MNTKFDLTIEPGKGFGGYWKELWQYRELFYFMAWRDILVRYKQTVIGIIWSVLRPLLTMVVFTLVFGKLAKMPSEGEAPYPVMVFAALLPWQLFSTVLTESTNSMVANANMISKIYFPRLIIPSSSAIVSLTDFLISFGMLLLIMFWYQFLPGWQILFLPIFLFIALIAALGAGLWLGALNVKYRDFRYIVPFMVQLGLYISPVGFSSSVIPDKYRLLYSLNPMVGVIDGFRWAILGESSALYWPGLLLSIVVTLCMITCGVTYFRSMERTFADII